MNEYKLLKGNNLELLKTLEDNSIDAIVSDPPYGLQFMNKKWDYDVPSVEFWKEVYRVVKPGGHILSFGGTRTYHRMVVNCEDAGFEVRDCISWIYGSGFPKSLNIGKAIDKIEGNERVVDIEKTENYKRNSDAGFKLSYRNKDITKGNSIYEGYGSSLKPAQEFILLARKPLSEKSIAENVLRWGTGGLNIDGTRINYQNEKDKELARPGSLNATGENSMFGLKSVNTQNELGRFPANIIFDEEAAKMLDEQSGFSKTNSKFKTKYKNTKSESIIPFNRGDIQERHDEGGASRFFYCAKVSKKERNIGCEDIEHETKDQKGHGLGRECSNCGTKMLNKEECKCENPNWIINQKNGNIHPTVKPINLMTYLVRLVAPPTNATILDPFMGSGSTGIAVMLEGHNFIGMEMDENYFEIAEARISNYEKYRDI